MCYYGIKENYNKAGFYRTKATARHPLIWVLPIF